MRLAIPRVAPVWSKVDPLEGTSQGLCRHHGGPGTATKLNPLRGPVLADSSQRQSDEPATEFWPIVRTSAALEFVLINNGNPQPISDEDKSRP